MTATLVSCSIVGDLVLTGSFQCIPVELVVDILSCLSLLDLISCRSVNRSLHDIIDSSQRLQHQIDTAIAGVVDNPNSNLTLPERRAALARRQEAWDTCKPQCTTTLSVQGIPFPSVIQNGFYFTLLHRHFPKSVVYRSAPHPNERFDRAWSRPKPSRTREGDNYNTTFVACIEENDLIAVGIRHWHPKYHPPSLYDVHSLEVDLLCFSSGGGGHPSARNPTLLVKDEGHNAKWEMKMEIHTSLLAVLLRPYSMDDPQLSPKSELSIFNWKTGEKIAWLKDPLGGVDAFRFLTDKVMVVAKGHLATLELFTLPIPKDNTSPLPLTKVAALGLPSVDKDYRLVRVDFHNAPGKSTVTRNIHQLPDVAVYTKPFTSDVADDIVFVRLLIIGGNTGLGTVSFVVHSSVLLHHVLSSSHVNVPDTIPWESWGPTTTRWFAGTSIKNNICGQRCLIMGTTSMEIWDFNQYRVKRLGKGFEVESDTARLSVETEPSCVRVWGLANGVYSSLGYVKLVAKQWSHAPMCLDDDRVFVLQQSVGEDYEVDQLYFG